MDTWHGQHGVLGSEEVASQPVEESGKSQWAEYM